MEAENSLPRIYDSSPLDEPIRLEQSLMSSFSVLSKIIQDKTELELHNIIQAQASQSTAKHNEMTQGLLYSILTSPDLAESHFHILSFTVRDQYADIISILVSITASSDFNRLSMTALAQLVWLIHHLAELRVQYLENVIILLLRQLRGGDLTERNLKLIEYVVNMLSENREWANHFPQVISLSCYSFLRLLREHKNFLELQRKEVDLSISLLREKFDACILIGRDLVRALHDVASIPKFSDLWKMILNEPNLLHKEFKGIHNLLKTPTPPWYLEYRLPPNIARDLTFLMANIETGNHSKPLSLFLKLHMRTEETHGLFPDLIRFIIGVFHPSNEVLASRVIPRFEVIGCLLKTIKSPVVAADVKLALFYDWLFFDRSIDNIMNIEPGILLIANSIESHCYMTEILVEFLAFASVEYFPDYSEDIRKGIDASMELLLEKGVVNSINPIYTNPNLDPEIRHKLLSLFGRFIDPSIRQPIPMAGILSMGREPAKGFVPPEVLGEYDDPVLPNFSPPEISEPIPLEPQHQFQGEDLKEHSPQGYAGHPDDFELNHESKSEEEVEEALIEFQDLFYNFRVSLRSWSCDDKVIMDNILTKFVESDLEADMLSPKLSQLLGQFTEYYLDVDFIPQKFIDQLFPRSKYLDNLAQGPNFIQEEVEDESEESYAQELEVPFISLFERVWQEFFGINAHEDGLVNLANSDSSERKVALLLIKLAVLNPSIGPYWLVYSLRAFFKEHKNMGIAPVDITCCYDNAAHPFRAYSQFVRLICAESCSSPNQVVASDLVVISQLEKTAFYCTLPGLFRFLPHWCVNNTQLIKLVAGGLDSIQYTYTISRIYRKILHIMDLNGVEGLIAESFNWEPESQTNFWMLVAAEFGGNIVATEVILEAYLTHSVGDGFEDNSDGGEILVKLSDLLQRVSPSLNLLKILFQNCYETVQTKKLGAWIVIMFSQWAQLWAPMLHLNFQMLLGDIQAKKTPTDGLPSITNDIVQWLKLLHCWCEENSFLGTPPNQQGKEILLGNTKTQELIQDLIKEHVHEDLDQLSSFLIPYTATVSYPSEMSFLAPVLNNTQECAGDPSLKRLRS